MFLKFFKFLFLFCLLFYESKCYLMLLNGNDNPGLVIFDAGIKQYDNYRRFYVLNTNKSAQFVKRLFLIDKYNGNILLKQGLRCDGIRYPNLFTIYVDSISNGTLEYVTIPIRVLIKGCNDIVPFEDDVEDDTRLSQAKNWPSETHASFSFPGYNYDGTRVKEICLRPGHPLVPLYGLLPTTVRNSCNVKLKGTTDDPRFSVEATGKDLVIGSNTVCLNNRADESWVVGIAVEYICHGQLTPVSPAHHTIKVEIVFRRNGTNDETNRVRRTVWRRSPSDPVFDRPLYVASVLEEQESGQEVCLVQVKPGSEQGVVYNMVSLLDSRSQGMLGINSQTGVVTTLTRLDRETMDVHYFRVTATDSSLPPRSATTTLQVNIGDTNDHAPIFEAPSGQLEAQLSESSPIGSIVTQLRASDLDMGINAQIHYSIAEIDSGGLDTGEGIFSVDPQSGLVTTRAILDRETTEVYTLVAKAIDSALPVETRLTGSVTLVIRIGDENDNYPQFDERTLTVTIPEDTTSVSSPVVALVKATDADSGRNSALRYAIIGGNTQGQFAIDSQNGEITLVKALDYESIRSYRLVIRAQDGGTPGKSNTSQVLVNVKDVNDNAPRFYTSLFQESISENVPIGYSIVRVQAYDGDEAGNAEVQYRISTHFNPESLPVTVDPQTGWLYTIRQLDRESEAKLNFEILAVDKGSPSKTGTATVSIVIQDTNDNDPQFSPKEYEASLSEDAVPGTSVVTVHATDPDENPRLQYEIISGNTRGRFSITTQNGRGLITIAQPLDYKQEKRFMLSVRATDSGGRYDTANVYLNISDANTFSPVFDNAPYTGTVPEDAKIGTTVLVVSATDGDTGLNAQITYSLASETEHFTINSETGAIITTEPLDRETTPGYLLSVTAKDNGTPQLSDNTDVEITITDVNDNDPKFAQNAYSVTISEDVPIGTSVIQISASDADMGLNGRIRYSIENTDQFIMEPITGVMRVNKPLDRESVAAYNILAVVSDRAMPPLSSTVIIHVNIDDVNDSPPTFESDQLTLYIPENSPIGSTVGEIYAKDPDTGPNAVVHYSIIGGDDASYFSLERRAGLESAELITLTELDYESSKKQYKIIIRATSPPLRSDAHVTIIVQDVNDNAPILPDFQVIFNNFRECFPSGSIGKVPAQDADVSDKLTYRILSGNNANLVILNETTGELNLSPQLNTNVPKLATMEVAVTDGLNEVKAWMELTVRLITDEMLLNSVTVRLADMTEQMFLSPLLSYFVEAVAAIIPCPKQNVYVFSIEDDPDIDLQILNVSFSVRQPDGQMFPAQLLQERVYLNRALLTKLSTLQVLPFDDNLCVREPCLNYEECSTVLKFGNASEFITSDTVLFRPIYPVTTFACNCPKGFIGKKEHYLCDTEVNLCYSNPCKNNGECLQIEGGFSCICSPEFTGHTCEFDTRKECGGKICPKGSTCKPLESGGYTCESCAEPGVSFQNYDRFCQLRARGFNRDNFITFPALKQRNRLFIKLKFSTLHSNGLLLYNGRYNVEHDFISLELINRNIMRFSFSLGSEKSSVIAKTKYGLNDGAWHTVYIKYYNRTATLSIDDCDTTLTVKFGEKINESCANEVTQNLENRCVSVTETCHRFLDLTGPLQIGGLPKLPKSQFQAEFKDFIGCIADIYIDHKLLDLNKYVGNNGSRVGCPERESHCSSKPCHNGGTCHESWGTNICECVDGWSGRNCNLSIPSAWSFNRDGQIVFNPLLRQIQFPWETEFSIRTRQNYGFIMAIYIGQNSTATFAIDEGYLKYFIDTGLSITLKAWPVNDGQWHRISAILTTTKVKLTMDSGWSEETSISSNYQERLIGKIIVGNSEDEKYDNGFSGCIQDIRLGSSQGLLLLQNPSQSMSVGSGCDQKVECSLGSCRPHSHCIDGWRKGECLCDSGYIGDDCRSVCDLNPCYNNGKCILDRGVPIGYSCLCNTTLFTGDYCEMTKEMVCPSSWWGNGPNCGPCNCDLHKGYSPNCNTSTGQCYCKDRHYFVNEKIGCEPCNCYPLGSSSLHCNATTGQCHCKSGVIGSKCDQCPNPYAQVTLHGCEVVYGGCPRHFSNGIWWEKTNYGSWAIQSCPTGSQGKAKRFCDKTLPGWREAEVFNCTSDYFIPLRRTLHQLEIGEVYLNTYVTVELSKSLHEAINHTKNLFGADILIAQQLLERLLKYESNQTGLTLTHVQHNNYIKFMVESVGRILSMESIAYWPKIETLTGESPHYLQSLFTMYMTTLAANMRDTYTMPFETITDNLVLGLDMVNTQSLYGYEVNPKAALIPGTNKELVIIPDTSTILQPPLAASLINRNATSQSPTILFPKYNNFVKSGSKFDEYSKILIPLDLLGIKYYSHGDIMTSSRSNGINTDRGGIVSYAFYRQGEIFPENYDQSVLTRWGVQLVPATSVVSVVAVNRDGNILLSGLKSPVRFQLWLKHDIKSPSTNPQCVRWTNIRGMGEWTRAGCLTELPSGNWWEMKIILVNCTCTTLSTHAVLIDLVADEYIRETTKLEQIISWIGLMAAIWCLGLALIAANLARPKSNFSSIQCNMILCLFLAELCYLISMKANFKVNEHIVSCKLLAISLHYLWLCVLSWWFISSVHLLRMLTQMRDINRGPMLHYYSISYAMPGIIVALSVAVRPQHYGNYYFCWISLYESAIWSLIGPGVFLILANLCVLSLALRAAFTVNHTITSYGNVRGLVWLNIAGTPGIVLVWLLSIAVASDHSQWVTVVFSLAVALHSFFILGVRIRVTPTLWSFVSSGKFNNNIPAETKKEADTSQRSPTIPVRSSMAYKPTATATSGAAETARRHLGISNSSTTSRSTTKTSSSPYRSDTQLRHNTTSTSSNYEPTSVSGRRRTRHTSESDSEVSVDGGRSLDLASSHSSDDEVTSSRNSKNNRKHPTGSATNLTKNLSGIMSLGSGSVEPTDPPRLNIVANSQLFQPIYGPRWPSNGYGEENVPHRWTNSTVSDNDLSGGRRYPSEVKLNNIYCPEDEKDGDKYSFPYTAEEDHVTMHHHQSSAPVISAQQPPPYGNSPSPLTMMHHHDFIAISETEEYEEEEYE